MGNILKNKRLILAGIAVLLVALLFIIHPGSEAEPKVELEASLDKTSYTAGEDINISLNLTNTGEVETCLSEGAAGNVHFESLTKDGEQVESRTSPAYFIAPLSEILKARLMPLAAGDNMEITLSSSPDAGLEANALKTTELQSDRGMATFYNVEAPGSYELKIFYEYPGEASEDCANVYEGRTNTSTATFTVNQ